MLFLYDNLNWMLFNLVLAFVPIVFVWLLRKKLHPFVHILLLFLWLIFLPNTIYLVTDIEYLPYQIFRSGIVEQALLFIEYGIIASFGVFSYLFSLEPAQLILKKLKFKKTNEKVFYIVLHSLVALGVVMGKVQRTHSWYVFTQPQRVVNDAKATLIASDLFFWVFFCAIVINSFFFVFKKYFPALVSGKKKK
jgi:uncharacterized membrane protein